MAKIQPALCIANGVASDLHLVVSEGSGCGPARWFRVGMTGETGTRRGFRSRDAPATKERKSQLDAGAPGHGRNRSYGKGWRSRSACCHASARKAAGSLNREFPVLDSTSRLPA